MKKSPWMKEKIRKVEEEFRERIKKGEDSSYLEQGLFRSLSLEVSPAEPDKKK